MQPLPGQSPKIPTHQPPTTQQTPFQVQLALPKSGQVISTDKKDIEKK